MKNILLRLRELKDDMSSTTACIAQYISDNPEEASRMTARQLANATFSSPSSVVRFCRAAGFEGYKEFRQQLMIELVTLKNDDTTENTSIPANASMGDIIRRVTQRNIQCLVNTQYLLDENTLSECVDLIEKSEKILLFGIGASLCVARDAYLKFLRVNKLCISNDDWHSQLLQAKNSGKNDLAIIFSYSGQTVEMIECIKELKNNGTKVVVVTRLASSPAEKMADYVLNIAAIEPVFRSGAASSRLAQLDVLDILYESYISRHYEECIQQISRTHIHKA